MRREGFDYSTPGYYVFTICQAHRMNLFAEIEQGGLLLNDAGMMIQSAVTEIPKRYANVTVDTYVVMPNHAHVILGLCVRANDVPDTTTSLDVMHWWKTVTTTRYIAGVKRYGWPRFDGELWKHGFFDRYIRDEDELNAHRHYIAENPGRWHEDEMNENS